MSGGAATLSRRRNESHAGSMFALSPPHISFAGTACDIYWWPRGFIHRWTEFHIPADELGLRASAGTLQLIGVHNVSGKENLNEADRIQFQQISPANW